MFIILPFQNILFMLGQGGVTKSQVDKESGKLVARVEYLQTLRCAATSFRAWSVNVGGDLEWEIPQKLSVGVSASEQHLSFVRLLMIF